MNLTKKVWNTLSYKTRVEIITIVKQTPVFPSYYDEFIHYNYSHDFDYNNAGKALKEILSHCRLQEDKTIDVVLTINPTYGGITKSKEQADKETKQKTKDIPKKTSSIYSYEPATYYIDYEDKDGDLCHVWVEAVSKEDAKCIAKREYWDIKEIINVRKE